MTWPSHRCHCSEPWIQVDLKKFNLCSNHHLNIAGSIMKHWRLTVEEIPYSHKMIDEAQNFLSIKVSIYMIGRCCDPSGDIEKIHEEQTVRNIETTSRLNCSNRHETCVSNNIKYKKMPLEKLHFRLGQFHLSLRFVPFVRKRATNIA